MTVTYSPERMLEYWRMYRAALPARHDCEVACIEGYDTDAWLTAEMETWFRALMERAPLQWFDPVDISDRVTVSLTTSGAASAALPQCVVRPVRVRLQGWEQPAVIEFDPQSAMARLQLNPLTRAGCCCPVAVLHGTEMMLYTPPQGSMPQMAELLALCRNPGDDFTVDSAATGLIPGPDEPLLGRIEAMWPRRP